MPTRNRRPSAFIVTIQRGANSAPESYYMTAIDTQDAKSRAVKMAKAAPEHVLEVISG